MNAIQGSRIALASNFAISHTDGDLIDSLNGGCDDEAMPYSEMT